jgi:hypothetical protein
VKTQIKAVIARPTMFNRTGSEFPVKPCMLNRHHNFSLLFQPHIGKGITLCGIYPYMASALVALKKIPVQGLQIVLPSAGLNRL